ncbi:MAG TPA: multicopper oxidase domain-containing protein [Thermoflexales bacterium]|nr:multicopper oxidase domain-containing protein [Thermoflexales bacterium]
MKKLNRRKFLKLSGLAAGTSLLAACAPKNAAPASTAMPGMAMGAAPTAAPSANFAPDLEIALKATSGAAQILPGKPTNVWRYAANVVKGDPGAVVTLPETYTGPIIRAKKGQKVRVTFTNDLPAGQPSIVHWHGLIVPQAADGHPMYQIDAGKTYVYEFEVGNRAGTYWFHPHTHGKTGLQVNKGLAGLFIVSDPEQDALALPSGEFDLPLVIQDRTFDADNQFVYDVQNMSGMNHDMGSMNMNAMMQGMMGFLGDRILVNGKPDFALSASTRAYRLRLLNGSNSRIYKLAWSDGTPITVLGVDGGLLDKPISKKYVMLAPAQRAEIWLDLSGRKVGDEITLESLAFETGETGGMMMGGGSAPALGQPMRILKVKVDKQSAETLKLPDKLTALTPLQTSEAGNAAAPRQFKLTLNGMTWLINNRQFEMDKAAADEVVNLGATEIWEFSNEKNPGAMMDANGMPHPIHMHGVQFNVLSREVLPDLKPIRDTVMDGIVDEGWRDTVLVMPGEKVRVIVRFTVPGRFLYHCHNLEHEDQGMMRNFDVKPLSA